jgi:outer membrane lipoprotein carrier protein
MKKILFILLVGYLGYGFADGITSLEQYLNNKNGSISATFKQVVLGQKSNQISTGIMKIARPNKFVWQYDSQGNNIGQTMISDGKKIYIVDKELEQVTIKNLGTALDKSPATILAGSNDIKRYYNIAAKPDNNGMEWVLLTPKLQDDNNGFQLVAMGFNKLTHLLQQMNFTSSLGSKTELNFTNLKVGVKYKANDFTYVVPKGYDVIDGNISSLGK